MYSFLFWNLYGRAKDNDGSRASRLAESLGLLAAAHQLDVLIFAECGIDSVRIEEALNASGAGPYYRVPGRSKRIALYSRLPGRPWRDDFYDPLKDRLAIQELRIGHAPTVLLVGVHFYDRQTIATEAGRALVSTEMVADIRKTEAAVGHERTILVGDLNMNPYEAGVVGTQALHAVMSRELARSIGRIRHRASVGCFYNPMWGLFGDGSLSPPGSYFYPNATDPHNHFWNLYDQVLVRPDIMDALKDVRVLDTDGTSNLITKRGRPRKATFSDHLPILFRLTI
jgi:hypothetical protein